MYATIRGAPLSESKSSVMRRLYFLFFASIILLSCSKAERDRDTNCFPDSWLTQKMGEFSSCTCLTGIYQATYLGQTIIEIKGIDPLCNGINIVYKTDGSVLLNSGDQPLYKTYLSSVQNLPLIWSCAKSK
jgi:hypothetical protein